MDDVYFDAAMAQVDQALSLARQLKRERDEARGEAKGWENVAGHARLQADEAMKLARSQNERANRSEEDAQTVGLERDEARAVANELFDAYKALFDPKVRLYFEAYRMGDWSEVGAAYGRIRPEVRALLEAAP